ncbi:MAG: hypothetical protein JNM43_21670 [Planctomycetaceae bacterium]|nr:hypothetical protein [Planctomycetaceae bacterium]
MLSLSTPQFRCLSAIGRCDITPPVGIYHRMWGAALHDRATGVHRPLTATMLWMRPPEAELQSDDRIIVSLDHCILETSEMQCISRVISEVTGVPPENVLVSLTHTHGSGWMSRARSEFPGGDMIGPYLEELRRKLAELARSLVNQHVQSHVVCQPGHCSLAGYRDFFDEERGHAVCGFQPEGSADDTVMVARFTDSNGRTTVTIVNYACHPTTLAWDNTLISPDWVGAMRETVEQNAGGLCLFLQGASGDLGPREGFVGDVDVADRNGRQVGFAVLSTLQTVPKPGTTFDYQGPVLSGTWIGTWKHVSQTQDQQQKNGLWKWWSLTVDLPYRHDLPTIEDTTSKRTYWLEEEAKARSTGDTEQLRKCRANAEQMTRQLTRLQALAPGRCCPFPVRIGLMGTTLWIFTPGELYQVFQQELRRRFPGYAIFVTTLTGDWQPGYVPPASSFGYGIYQEVIAATAPGCLEALIEEVSRSIHKQLR